MSDPQKPVSIRSRIETINIDEERQKLIQSIQDEYVNFGKYRVTYTEQKNIMLIGRTRVGKSTIKSLLVDPTVVPTDLSLKAGTKDPVFESFHAKDNQIVLNIIDTPGLFERSNSEIDIRDNDTILKTIGICINREITKFHVVCFCVAITEGINQQDIESLKLLVNYLGEKLSENSCLIITRCESKDEEQRTKMRTELLEDYYFKDIASFFKLGIFFSGTLNPDDYKRASSSLLNQFLTISDYRTQLINIFVSDIKPFPIGELVDSEAHRRHEREERKDAEIKQMKTQLGEQARIIDELQKLNLEDKKQSKATINKLVATTKEYEEKLKKKKEQEENEDPQPSGCPIS